MSDPLNVILRRLRGDRSMNAVATAAGIDRAAIFHYEAGDRAPTLPRLHVLLDALDVGFEDRVAAERAWLDRQRLPRHGAHGEAA